MILTIFLSLLGLAAFLVVLGYITDDDIYTPIGLALLFLMGAAIINDGVSYVDGNTMNSTYAYVNGTVSSVSASVGYSYVAWNDTTSHIIGWALAIIGFAGFILSLLMMRYRRVEEV